MKTLIIAEKPSVAADLARVFKVKKQGDYFENDEFIISSAVGHLVELLMPEEIDAGLKAWKMDTLPIMPERFALKPIKSNEDRFKQLKKLLARKDVGEVVNACDAGREGELIFTYLYEAAKCKKPVKRLWMSSMTPEAIREAFNAMREGEAFSGLRDAARSRSEADWLIGINGTRGATITFGRRGGTAATVGRVQTPTLAMVVEREKQIRDFVPRSYWQIAAQFDITRGTYEGFYQRPDFKKSDDEHDRADRIWQEDEARRIAAQVESGGPATLSEQKKRTRQGPPRLYDLTTLQREANARYGLPAGATLSAAQALYERHKMITYPRTDSKALPEDYPNTVYQTLRELESPYAEFAAKVLENNWVNPKNKRVFDNKQVSDHFAIIPTGQSRKIEEREQKVYDMIVRRFIAIFYPFAEYDVTTRYSDVGPHRFKTEGKVLMVPGWLEVYGKSAAEDTLPPLVQEDGEPAHGQVAEVEVREDQTRPPPRYTEATLLAAMEGAGKLVDDDELAEAMKEKGLGTPATRAQIIDHLAKERYIERQGREISPTMKAESLIEFLERFDIDVLTRPELTGEWEHKLRQVEEGKLTREAFMQGIRAMAQRIIDNLGQPPPADTCDVRNPIEGTPLLADHRAFFSKETVDIKGRAIPKISVNRLIGNRLITEEEVSQLLQKGEVGPLDGFRSRQGKPFSAMLKLVEKPNTTLRAELDFGNDGGGGDGAENDLGDLSQYEVVGTYDVDGSGAKVYAAPNAYISENFEPSKDKSPSPARGFRLSRTMLGRTLQPGEVRELLEKGKTPLLKGFRSNRTRKLFDAHLVLKEDGGIGFEFPPRKAAKKAARKSATKKTPQQASE